MKQKRIQALIVFLIIALIVTACGGDDEGNDSNGSDAPEAEVSMQLAWVHTMEYSGFYMAEDKGYYADENLTVDLLEGGFDEEGNFIFPISLVANGDADFGLIGGDQLLKARAEGTPVVAIAAIYQISPVVFMTLAENNINRPEDMVGKTIAIDLESATGLSFIAMLNAADVSVDDVNVVPRTDFSNAPLINGDVDILDGFITNQPVVLAAEGYDLNLILASDYGIDFYANVIFTTEDMIANQPDVVERFLRASLKGYEEAIDNPEAAVDLSVARNDTLNRENELEGMRVSVPLIEPANSKVGYMDGEIWEYMDEVLSAEGLMSTSIDAESAYTLTFLDAIYNEEE